MARIPAGEDTLYTLPAGRLGFLEHVVAERNHMEQLQEHCNHEGDHPRQMRAERQEATDRNRQEEHEWYEEIPECAEAGRCKGLDGALIVEVVIAVLRLVLSH